MCWLMGERAKFRILCHHVETHISICWHIPSDAACTDMALSAKTLCAAVVMVALMCRLPEQSCLCLTAALSHKPISPVLVTAAYAF